MIVITYQSKLVLRVLKAEVTVRQYNEMMKDLKKQRKPSQYECPQVVLEKINPAWLVHAHVVGKGEGFLRRLFGKKG